MAKLYYGNGKCEISGSDIRGVEIRYKGIITIDDKTSDSFVITHQNNGIMIFPIGEGILNELFDYQGEIRIKSVLVADSKAERVPTTIHKVMDYSELLNTNAEDMTTISENLKSTHKFGNKMEKTTLKKKIIPNLRTSNNRGDLYLESGDVYSGYYHIHLKDNTAMTGKDYYSVHFVTESVITSIAIAGATTDTGSAIANLNTTIPAGTIIFGRVTAINLASGVAICYTETDEKAAE